MNNTLVIPIAIITAGIIIGGAIYLESGGGPTGTGDPTAVRPLDATDHYLGSPTAKAFIVEYSDFDCPHCKTFDSVLRQAVREYGTGGGVSWVLRNFPIFEAHPNAPSHAIAAECVAQTANNEAYWKFTELLFANQPTSPTKYAELAQASGASPDAVASCIQNAGTNGIKARVDADRANALAAGAKGTPYSLILVEGKAPIVVDGAISYPELKERLDAALAATTTPQSLPQ